MSEVPDRVVMTNGPKPREAPVEEYFKYPLDVQLEILMRGQVKFFRGQKPLRTIDALKVLRERKAA